LSNTVIITSRAELDDVIKALRQVEKAGVDVQESMADTGKAVENKLRDNTKKTQKFLEDLKDFARRAADEIRGSFEGLAKAGALKLGDRLGHELKTAVTGAQRLNDTLRRVGNTLGLTGADFVQFQTEVSKRMGALKLDTDAAANAFEGLGETQVRSKDALQDYAAAAGLLAGVGKERGQEGAIAKGIAGVITERGGDVNDRGQMQQVINSTLSTMQNTGKSATQALAEMKDFFHGQASDKYRAFEPKAYAGMALAEANSPGAMDFFKSYNNQSALGRLPAAAQGLGKAFGENGLNIDYLRKFLPGATGRIGFSKEDAMRTFGVDEAGAKGAVRLMQNLDKIEAAQKRAQKNRRTLGEAYDDSLGFGEAVQGGFNRVKGMAAEPLAKVTNGATDIAKKISNGDFSPLKEHAGLLAGVGFLGLAGGLSSASKLFGKGGAGSALGSSLAAGAAAEAITGQKTIPVYVVNYSQIGGAMGGGIPGIGGGGASSGKNFLGAASMMLGAVGVGLTAGTVTVEALNAYTYGKSDKTGVEGNYITQKVSEAQQWLSDITAGLAGVDWKGIKQAHEANAQAINEVRRAMEQQAKQPGRKNPKQVPLGDRGSGQ